MSALPTPLKQAIEDYAGRVSLRERAQKAAGLSERYRAGFASAQIIAGEEDVAAYLTARLPATYAAALFALREVRARAPGFAPKTMLDAGSGPGTASFAAAEIWPGLERVTMMDQNARFLEAAEVLARASPLPALVQAEFVTGDFAAIESPLAYDLVIVCYALGELEGAQAGEAALRLWHACRGALVIVEPGTPLGAQRVLAARNSLIAEDATVVAPCPAGFPCPLAPPDWCHFAARLPRSRAHLRAKGATLPFEDEKFSYVAVARAGITLSPPRPRILARPQETKAAIRFKLCADGRVAEQTVLRRSKTDYRSLAKRRWGEVL